MNDQQDLRKFGYAQELFREMGGFSNFAISFSNISILTGAVTLFAYGLEHGGPLEMSLGWSLGWPLASLLTLAVAASMAEMCSAFPTSGALYHWTAILAFAAICLTQGALNAYGVKAVAWLNDASVTVHIIGTLILVGTLFFFAPHQPVSFLTKGTSTGGFVLGFLQAMWTLSGYDAYAHMAEETTDPRKHAPWASCSASASLAWSAT